MRRVPIPDDLTHPMRLLGVKICHLQSSNPSYALREAYYRDKLVHSMPKIEGAHLTAPHRVVVKAPA